MKLKLLTAMEPHENASLPVPAMDELVGEKTSWLCLGLQNIGWQNDRFSKARSSTLIIPNSYIRTR
jgi:hypothetical protein